MAIYMLHIVIINYTYADNCRTPEQWLAQASCLIDWAEGVQGPNVKVTVFQRFTEEVVIHRAHVTYHLITDSFRSEPRAWQLPRRLNWSVHVLCTASLQAGYNTLAQVNGLHFPLQTLHLRSILPQRCAMAVHHRGEQPWSLPQRVLQRWGLRQIDGFLFADKQVAQTWIDHKAIGAQQALYTIAPATASSSEKESAGRQATAIYEEIVFQRLISVGKT